MHDTQATILFLIPWLFLLILREFLYDRTNPLENVRKALLQFHREIRHPRMF